MRTPSRTLLVVVALLSLAAARPALAQSHRPFSIGVSGGATFLGGSDRDFYDNGYNAQLSFLVPVRAADLTLRLDAAYLGVPGRNKSTQTVAGAPDTLLIGDLSVFAGTLSAQIESSPSRAVRTYLTIGGGFYRLESKGVLYGQDVSASGTKAGIAGGVGLDFPVFGRRGFVEARIHNIFNEGTSARIYPLSVGLLF